LLVDTGRLKVVLGPWGMLMCFMPKGVGAPIFHCNGDDPEGVVQCCRLAVDWRQVLHPFLVCVGICMCICQIEAFSVS
jgi:hypothetical protein